MAFTTGRRIRHINPEQGASAMRSILPAVVILAAGSVLLVWGVAASDSFSSHAREFFHSAPSTKAIALMLGGGLLTVVALTRLLRPESR